ncbi:MAG: hypothetical protein IPK16_33230 [Anaerolineales bacterium]|nr:hypothetical protein [Anaerolineales bacterium]
MPLLFAAELTDCGNVHRSFRNAETPAGQTADPVVPANSGLRSSGDGVAVTLHFDLGLHMQLREQGRPPPPRVQHQDLDKAVEGVAQFAG